MDEEGIATGRKADKASAIIAPIRPNLQLRDIVSAIFSRGGRLQRYPVLTAQLFRGYTAPQRLRMRRQAPPVAAALRIKREAKQ
jgi:hypothetical protein